MKRQVWKYKNRLTATMCALVFCPLSFAQSKDKNYYWNEVGVSMGVGARPRGGMDAHWGLAASYAVHYLYHLDKRWAVGLQGGYVSQSGSEWDGDPLEETCLETREERSGTQVCYYTSKMEHHTYSLLPAAKFIWLDGRWCRLYAKVGVGGYVQRQTFQYDYYTSRDDYNQNSPLSGSIRHETIWRAAWQVTPLGLDIGTQGLRFFTEWQLGTLPSLHVGLIYRFRKK